MNALNESQGKFREDGGLCVKLQRLGASHPFSAADHTTRQPNGVRTTNFHPETAKTRTWTLTTSPSLQPEGSMRLT